MAVGAAFMMSRRQFLPGVSEHEAGVCRYVSFSGCGTWLESAVGRQISFFGITFALLFAVASPGKAETPGGAAQKQHD